MSASGGAGSDGARGSGGDVSAPGDWAQPEARAPVTLRSEQVGALALMRALLMRRATRRARHFCGRSTRAAQEQRSAWIRRRREGRKMFATAVRPAPRERATKMAELLVCEIKKTQRQPPGISQIGRSTLSDVGVAFGAPNGSRKSHFHFSVSCVFFWDRSSLRPPIVQRCASSNRSW